MKKISKIIVSVIAIFSLTFASGCDVMNNIGGAYRLSQSIYKYSSLGDIQLAGMNLGNASSISLSNLASIATVLAGGSNMQNIPFSMTLNMDVTNPNTAAAFLDALDYQLLLNDMELRSEERRVGKSVDLGGRRIIKKKKRRRIRGETIEK